MIKKLSYSLYLLGMIAVSCAFLFACGGGGGGSAGQQSVLKVVNATTDAVTLDVAIEEQPFFSAIGAGQASVFKEVLAGDRLIRVSEPLSAKRILEIQNEFAFGIPYTLIVAESDSQFLPIVALNDRSDTPQAQFRIRAINASKRSGSILVKLVPGTVGRNSDSRLALRALTPTVNASSTTAATVTPTAITPTIAATVSVTASAAATVSSLATQAQPTLSQTPTGQPASTATIAATASQPVQETPLAVSTVTIAQNLNFQGIGDYNLLPRSDYRIVVEASGIAPQASGVISFGAGQIITVVIRDSTAAEGAGVSILRLDDKP